MCRTSFSSSQKATCPHFIDLTRESEGGNKMRDERRGVKEGGRKKGRKTKWEAFAIPVASQIIPHDCLPILTCYFQLQWGNVHC